MRQEVECRADILIAQVGADGGVGVTAVLDHRARIVPHRSPRPQGPRFPLRRFFRRIFATENSVGCVGGGILPIETGCSIRSATRTHPRVASTSACLSSSSYPPPAVSRCGL